MIPILYEKTEMSFINNGLCRLHDMVSCEVTEERNGVYECNFTYPVDGANYEKIQCGRIIGVIHDDTKTIQPFDIVSYSRPINGLVSFHAVHISYRLAGHVVAIKNIANIQEAVLVLEQVGAPFTFDYDVMRYGYMAAANGVPISVRKFIGGVQGSMLDTYGGELEWDKFNVIFHRNRGRLTDFNIRYGLNMVDYEDETDFSNTYNRCIPYWTDGQNKIVYGDIVSSGFSTYAERNICIPLDLSDKFETQPTKAQLEQMGVQYMQNNQTHIPRQTIKVDFVRPQDSEEYKQFESLLQCNLCDSVGVVFPRYGMQGTFKIVKTVYDVLAERYKEMELGALSVTLSEALGINETAERINDIIDPADYVEEIGEENGWTYIKWHSGIFECFCHTTATVSVSTASGNIYRTSSAYTINLPFTPVTIDYGEINPNTTSYMVWPAMTSFNAENSTMACYFLSSSSFTNRSINIRAYAKGRWK